MTWSFNFLIGWYKNTKLLMIETISLYHTELLDQGDIMKMKKEFVSFINNWVATGSTYTMNYLKLRDCSAFIHVLYYIGFQFDRGMK